MAYPFNPEKNMLNTTHIIIPDIKNHNNLFVVNGYADYSEKFYLKAYLKNVPLLIGINGNENESGEVLDNNCKCWKYSGWYKICQIRC